MSRTLLIAAEQVSLRKSIHTCMCFSVYMGVNWRSCALEVAACCLVTAHPLGHFSHVLTSSKIYNLGVFTVTSYLANTNAILQLYFFCLQATFPSKVFPHSILFALNFFQLSSFVYLCPSPCHSSFLPFAFCAVYTGVVQSSAFLRVNSKFQSVLSFWICKLQVRKIYGKSWLLFLCKFPCNCLPQIVYAITWLFAFYLFLFCLCTVHVAQFCLALQFNYLNFGKLLCHTLVTCCRSLWYFYFA